ncbi:hypothetical protein BC835DRAFT_4129 [Cytidiella melzeri]|nr:hypothetical protein BC835DRAFT_4129 [Cytidiella melzeri]
MSDTRHDLTEGKTGAVERLDVEDEENRQQRLYDVLMHLDKSTNPRQRDAPHSFDFGDSSTFMLEPPRELLSRVQAFLPEFAASTAEITRKAQDDPESVDIEKLQNEGPYIRMDLGLGVFEERKGASNSSADDSDTEMQEEDAKCASSSSGTSNSDSRSDSDSSDEYDSDSPLPRRKSTRPDIVVLGEES